MKPLPEGMVMPDDLKEFEAPQDRVLFVLEMMAAVFGGIFFVGLVIAIAAAFA